jgi:hypothetical protein
VLDGQGGVVRGGQFGNPRHNLVLVHGARTLSGAPSRWPLHCEPDRPRGHEQLNVQRDAARDQLGLQLFLDAVEDGALSAQLLAIQLAVLEGHLPPVGQMQCAIGLVAIRRHRAGEPGERDEQLDVRPLVLLLGPSVRRQGSSLLLEHRPE